MSDLAQRTDERIQLEGRKLANAMNLLLSDLADAIDERFTHDGNVESEDYLANYVAHRSAYGAVMRVLTAPPPNKDFRAEVFQFIKDAWDLTLGEPQYDDVIDKCIGRAADDYKGDTPDKLKRPAKASRPAKTKDGGK